MAIGSAMSGRKTRLLYIVPPTRSFAGIERVTDSICSALASNYEQDLEVSVLYTSPFEQIIGQQRPYDVILSFSKGRLDLLRRVRRTVANGQFDLVIVPQVEPTAVFWLCCLGIRRRFILYLHGNPRLERRSLKASLLFEAMRYLVLPRLARIFGTSPRQLEAFRADYPSRIEHVWVPNPVRSFDVPVPALKPALDGPVRFVTVGRFAYQKGYDILLRVFAAFCKEREGAELVLVGYGEEEPTIRALIDELDLAGKVTIEHHPDSPAIPLSRSDIYLSGARWEGWSLAICEALRFGLPVIAFDCEFGPSDIIIDERIGRLVALGDMAGFVAAMVYYRDHAVSERRHAQYRADYINRFSLDKVVHAHARALLAAAGRVEQPPLDTVNAELAGAS
ncbi:glycosyltransferase involved in cell wall biosynthesis [Bosea sp. BE125]|uniref:glycosyltransferase n=1 Tax=Bosea sp. BE125 TaxID=2817909 RepID=UPI00285ADF3B|nr:glycosyltransferase [Bosea sp. BE125]MDR6873002.1 glycosyltransferase involved in cell wall biosynthesis [Bosea sp. BE125]